MKVVMADPLSMPGLFDSDTSFLDELTGPGSSNIAPPSQGLGGPMGGPGPGDPGMMMQRGMDQGLGPTGLQPQMHPISPQQQQQVPGAYGQMGQMPGQMHVQGISPHSAQAQKLHHYTDFDQYGSPKLHHMDNTASSLQMAAATNQGPNMMSHSPQQQAQFGSPPPGSGHMQSPPGSYPPYSMHNSPRMPTPPRSQQSQALGQQMAMNQGAVWNQQSPGTVQNRPIYMQQQQMPQSQAQAQTPLHQMPPYLSHHDYALPPQQQQQQRLSHFPDQQGQVNMNQNNYGVAPSIGSPPPTGRLTHMPMSNTMSGNMSAGNTMVRMTRASGPMSAPGAYTPTSQTVMGPQSQGSMSTLSMQGFSSPQTQTLRDPFSDEPMQQLSSGPQVTGTKLQHFPYTHNQQPQNQNLLAPQGVGDAPPLSHFPQSPTHNNQYRQPYPGIGQQHPNASPRPTPPPPSRTPTTPIGHPPTSTQGSFPQSSLQQLEQLVPPHASNVPQQAPSSPFGARMPQNTSLSANVNRSQPVPVSAAQPFGNPNYMSSTSQPSMPSPNHSGPMINTSLANRPGPGPIGQVSPNLARAQVMTPNLQKQQNMNLEIQQLQQQITQLYNMPQTPQTQQQMLDLQERMRTLKAQQQQGILLQRQQQMQQQQMMQQQQQQHQPVVVQQQQPRSIAPKPPAQQPLPPRVPQQPMQMPQQIQVVLQHSPLMQPLPSPQKIQQQSVQQPPDTSPQVLTPPSNQAPTPGTPQLQQPPTPQEIQQPLQHQLQQLTPPPQPLLLEPQLQPDNLDDSLLEDGNQDVKARQQQEKANRIVAEAIAKAKAAGLKDIPRVVTPPPEAVQDTPGKSSGSGSETKTAKKKKKSGKKTPKAEKEKKPKPASKPKVSKPSSKKKKPPATFIKLKKKKKKGSESEASDKEHTPPASPKEDPNIQKRRSARHTKRKKYLDDIDLNLSDDENQDVDIEGVEGGIAPLRRVQFFVENPNEEDAQIVEKILGMRTGKRPKKKEKEENEDEANEEAKPEEIELEEVEEFYVKYKNFSYLHCEWKTMEELERGDKRVQMKIKRYKMKRLQQNNYFAQLDEDELFNPDYVEVDRVLEKSITKDPQTDEEVVHYLVKWRTLPYEESTWELAQDVDNSKIEAFSRVKEPPPEEEQEVIERPKAAEWKKLDESPAYNNGNKLREYQLEGVNWLTFSYYNKQNCILADEMGLGKTIQSITFLNEIVKFGIKGPFLVVAPLSTIANWQREFETWTDMNVIVYHGSTPSRTMIQEYEMYYKDENGFRIPDIYKFHALITTYEIIISDCEQLSQIEWRATVIDEAHRLKNAKCKLMEGLKVFMLEHRVLLTGTPLQNNVEELFSLLNFLEPKRFNSSDEFLKEFGELKTESQVEKLKQLLRPMMLRRLKEDVEKNLAPKEETIVEVELTNIQKKYYRAILERNFSFLAKGTGSTNNVPNLMNTMMELRKCCNHPYLVSGAEEKILEETRVTQGSEPEKLFQAMIQSSGKLVLIDKLLPKLKQGDHKVLIFSQMIRVLDILEDYLIHKRYLYERLDGRIRGNVRQEAIDRFSKPDSDRFVFLLCTRAGGLGINLTAADTVIIFDSDWNPQNDLQAQARCHRIGQEKAVKVYRLITRNSYEREMFDRASLKLGLDKAVLQSMKDQSNPQQQLSKGEIEDLLRKGAYGALMEDDKEGDQFCEEDIEQILQRRTKVIQIETEGKGSVFAKASFSLSDNRSDIDIDDPNFWQKWAKKAELDADYLMNKNELIIEEPRRRKQTARYGNQDILDMSELETSDSDAEEQIQDMKKQLSLKKKGRRRKQKDVDGDFEGEEGPVDGYTRAECFKVEKNLLVYGWGRWEEVLAHGRFKRKLLVKDVETISRAMLAYSLKHYKGDERIKGFIWDLISTSQEEGSKVYKNHSGLSAPVPRGRKGKKAKKEAKNMETALEIDMANSELDPESVLTDEGYKKHLQRHSNKVLLRVRLLYYLRQEVIGDQFVKVFQGVPVKDIDIPPPCPDGEPPVFWWDEEADKSLLIGVFKHGYEKYNLMRQDPALSFLGRCGPPTQRALMAEQNDEDYDKDEFDDPKSRFDEDNDSPGSPGSSTPSKLFNRTMLEQNAAHAGKLPFPGPSDLNTRLRRVVTGYQRSHKKEQLKIAQRAKRMERRERFEAAIKEKQVKKREQQQRRWSRREEADFYRTVSTFGVERERGTGRFKWETFRNIARLEKKYDDTLTEYFYAFYCMCQRVCKKFRDELDAVPPNNLYVEPITEERASRCLARIDLLNKVREETLFHPQLDERLELCQPSYDMPDWWECGRHDKDLLIGAARHGLARTDYHILHDPKLSFREIVKAKNAQNANKLSPYTMHIPTLQNQIATSDSSQSEAVVKPELKAEPSGGDEEKVNQEPATPEKPKPKAESEDGEVKEETEVKTEENGVAEDVKKEEEDVKEEKVEIKEEGVKTEEEEPELQPKEESIKSEVEKVVKEEEEDDRKEEMPLLEEMRPEHPSQFQSLSSYMGEDSFLNDGEPGEPTVAELLARSMNNPAIQWPKDKVIFHRLEHISQCVEKGEWPVSRRHIQMLQQQQMMNLSATEDSRASTPGLTPSSTPRPESDTGTPEALRGFKADGLKLTFQKKRGRKRKTDKETERAEKAARLHEILGVSHISSAGDSESESNLSGIHMSGENTFLNGSSGGPVDFSPLRREVDSPSLVEKKIEGIINQQKKKRGRKRKIDKLLEEAEAAARMKRSTWSPSCLDPEARVAVVNLEDGSRLSGDEAPLRKDLDRWLDEHPGYMVDRPEPEEEEPMADKRRKRRPRVDPNKLDLNNLTGEENVSVINRDTGKKITGAKAPPLKHLAEWLEKNPSFDVDPKWSNLVRAKGNLPEDLRSRVLSPQDKRRRSNTLIPPNMLSAEYFPAVTSMGALSGLAGSGLMNMAGFPKLPFSMPFGGLPTLGLANPMYNLASFGLMPGATTKLSSSDSKGGKSSNQGSPSSKQSSASSTSTPTMPHPSFPFLYNPMLFNPLFAQTLGNFSLPTNVPTSFASLAKGKSAVNGIRDSDEEELRSDSEQEVAEDLSMKKKPSKESEAVKKTKKVEEIEDSDADDEAPMRLVIAEEERLENEEEVEEKVEEEDKTSEKEKEEIEEVEGMEKTSPETDAEEKGDKS